MSALSAHNRPPCRKKSILAEVSFDEERGVIHECNKMNFYLKRPPLVLDFVPFAAKCSAFWCKM